jgi:hypothetical protein
VRALLATVECLYRETDVLVAAVAQETVPCDGDTLADRILPLSLKEVRPGPSRLRLAGLERQIILLERESRYLREHCATLHHRSWEVLARAMEFQTRAAHRSAAAHHQAGLPAYGPEWASHRSAYRRRRARALWGQAGSFTVGALALALFNREREFPAGRE